MKNPQRRALALAAGLAASFGSVYAQSSVQLYGVADLFIAKRQLASASGASTTSAGSGGMTTTQWGVRGSEDLGGGLKTLFDFSGFIRADTGDVGRFPADPMFSRSALVGVQGAWGTLRLGRISTPNFISTIRLNPFGDSTTFSPVTLHTYVGGQPLDAAIASGGPAGVSDSSHGSSVAYTSPDLGGLTAAGQYSFGGLPGGANRRMGYSLTYGNGPLLVSLSGETIHKPTLPPVPVVPAANQKQGQDTLQLGASYDLTAVKLFAQWSQTEVELPAGASRDFRTVQLGASAPLGAGKLLASVADTRREETALSDVKRTTWALGYDHSLSRRTDLYAVFMRDRVSGLQSGTTVAAGIRHRF